MKQRSWFAAVLVILSVRLFAQGVDEGFGSHIIWKQEIKGVVATGLDQATADSAGDLWLVSNPFDAEPGWGVSSVNYDLRSLLEKGTLAG